MHKIFEVLINEKTYDVFNIEGKEHEGWNGEPKTWWLYYAEKLPEGLTPSLDSEDWVPYCRSINRTLWDISYKQVNRSKVKWDDVQFNCGGYCEMKCNGKLIYGFFSRSVESALSKAQYLTVTLLEFPGFNFLEPEKENGRKIFWYGLPATVSVWRKDTPWEIGIIPDYTTGFTKAQWWKEYNERRTKLTAPSEKYKDPYSLWDEGDNENDTPQDDFINWGDAFSDQHIDWFRN